ncbi:MAG: SMC-Scp complex subunit ScpB [Myxococcota bacterium]
MALGDERLRSIVESLLLISPDPVPVSRLVEVVRIEDPHTEEEAVRNAIDALIEAYSASDRPLARGFRVEEVAGGLQLRTVAENAPFVRRYLAAKPQRLSRAALETLAIVAYRQPVTKPEIEAIRGVDAGAALRSLLDRELVKIVGKKDEVGRPLIYGTTPFFLEFFTLKSLGELPTLREFHELDEASTEEVSALEGGAPTVQELAEAAQFLVERDDDPDLDALDAAVKAADAAKKAAELALDPTAAAEAAGEGKAQAPEPREGEVRVADADAQDGEVQADPRGEARDGQVQATPAEAGEGEVQPAGAEVSGGQVRPADAEPSHEEVGDEPDGDDPVRGEDEAETSKTRPGSEEPGDRA